MTLEQLPSDREQATLLSKQAVQRLLAAVESIATKTSKVINLPSSGGFDGVRSIWLWPQLIETLVGKVTAEARLSAEVDVLMESATIQVLASARSLDRQGLGWSRTYLTESFELERLTRTRLPGGIDSRVSQALLRAWQGAHVYAGRLEELAARRQQLLNDPQIKDLLP